MTVTLTGLILRGSIIEHTIMVTQLRLDRRPCPLWPTILDDKVANS